MIAKLKAEKAQVSQQLANVILAWDLDTLTSRKIDIARGVLLSVNTVHEPQAPQKIQ